jgi:hypothetical protein
MLRRSFYSARAAGRDALVHIASDPVLWGFYAILLLWTTLGVFTLFVGMLGLLAQGLALLLLVAAALAICFAVGRSPTRLARGHALAALALAAGMLSSCPNRAGPQVFFAVHGARLDALARDMADARGELWIGVASGRRSDPPFNVDAGAVEGLRARVKAAGVLSMGTAHGWVIFPVDGFADNARGFAYVPPGVPPPLPGGDFTFGQLAQWIPMSRPGWYFFTTT